MYLILSKIVQNTHLTELLVNVQNVITIFNLSTLKLAKVVQGKYLIASQDWSLVMVLQTLVNALYVIVLLLLMLMIYVRIVIQLIMF